MAQESIHIRKDTGVGRRLRVGALILVGLAVIVLGVYEAGRVFDVFASRYTLVTLVPSAAGLRQGAPVTLAGQRVGQVGRLSFIPLKPNGGPDHVAISLDVDTDVRQQIRTDSRAVIRTQGLLGDKYVDISPGSIGARVLENGDTLPGTRVVDLESIMATTARTMEDAQQVIAQARDLTSGLLNGEGTAGRLLRSDSLYRRMDDAALSLDRFMARVNRGGGTLGRLARDSTLYDQTRTTLEHVDSLTRIALSGHGTLGRMLSSDTLYQRALSSVSRLDATLASLNAALTGVNEGDGTLHRLLADPALYDQLLKAVVDVQTLIRDIREHPNKYRPQMHIF